jgi:hypothetical protein
MWEYCGNTVGIWKLDRVALRPLAFGRAPGPGRRDIIGQFSDTG